MFRTAREGLATVLSLLGLSATYAGKVMGSSTTFGSGMGSTVLPLAASAFAVAMGLNVLELVKLDLPSFEGGLEYMTSLPKNARAYLLGGGSLSAAGISVFLRFLRHMDRIDWPSLRFLLAGECLGFARNRPGIQRAFQLWFNPRSAQHP